MMGHAGPMSHDDTVDNLTLFAKEVLPRLKAYEQPRAEAPAQVWPRCDHGKDFPPRPRREARAARG